MHHTLNITKSSKLSYLLVFLAAIMLRALPELMVSGYPVGYETITWYAPVMMTFYGRSLVDVFLNMLRSGPLFYVLVWLPIAATGAHSFLILKITAPLLYGGMAASYLLFLKRGLKLEAKMALVGALLLIFQVATLRESWDRFRNVLALIFLFATLTALKSNGKHKWLLISSFAVLTALSREYISLVLFATVLGYAVLERKKVIAALVALAPGLAVFSVMVYPARFWWNYVGGGAPTFYSETYLGVVLDVLFIFTVCFLPLMPFVIKGFKRNRLLDPMLALLLLGSFSALFIPWFALPGYQRWLILLVFPFTVYAVLGFERLQLFSESRIKILIAVILIFMLLGVGYSTGTFSYVILPSSWVPTSLVQSSIPWNQVDDVKSVLSWLDQNAEVNSSILAEERFYGWTLIYLQRAKSDVEVLPYGASLQPTQALEDALSGGFSWIYLIWYANSSFENFSVVNSQNSISLFKYKSSFSGQSF